MSNAARSEQMWDSPNNARAYADFCREYPLYRQPGRDLIAILSLPPDATVIDLACGTGSTTGEILAVLGPRGRVIGCDSSAAMLDVAGSNMTDSRVTWRRSRAETVTVAEPVDAVVCTAAIWQTEVADTAATVHRALRPGGRFAFTLDGRLAGRARSDQRSDAPALCDIARHLAEREHGWRPPPAPARARTASRPSRTAKWMCTAIQAHGFTIDRICRFSYRGSREEERAWLSIPMFAAAAFPGLDQRDRTTVLDRGYDILRGTTMRKNCWLAVTATRGPADPT